MHAPDRPPEFDEIYRDSVDRVARWVRRLAGPGLDVEDLVQEVFLVCHRRLPEFRGEARLSTWLYRITENVVLDRRRTERRRRWLRGLFGGGEIPGSAVEDPAQSLEGRQAAEVLYRILDALPERSRTLLILFELEGLPGEEIAEMTGTKLSNVWVYLHRARTQLRQRVEALADDERLALGAARLVEGRRP
jgi:RNA polymerase sigma-70 factor, ECF subfamily